MVAAVMCADAPSPAARPIPVNHEDMALAKRVRQKFQSRSGLAGMYPGYSLRPPMALLARERLLQLVGFSVSAGPAWVSVYLPRVPGAVLRRAADAAKPEVRFRQSEGRRGSITLRPVQGRHDRR